MKVPEGREREYRKAYKRIGWRKTDVMNTEIKMVKIKRVLIVLLSTFTPLNMQVFYDESAVEVF